MMNKKYITMCVNCDEIQDLKDDFEEGDLLFDGSKVRVVAEDFINIGKWISPDANVIEVAIKDSESNEKVKFSRRTLKNAKYIPRASQIAEWFEDERKISPYELIQQLYKYSKKLPNYCMTDSLSELLLKYFMEKKYDKYWSKRNEWEMIRIDE